MAQMKDNAAESCGKQDILEIRVRIPANDPRFAAMRNELRAAQSRGRGSRCPRMLAEWALIGRMLMTGEWFQHVERTE